MIGLSQSAGGEPAARPVAASSPLFPQVMRRPGGFNSVLAAALASMSPGRLTVSREGRVSASYAPPSPNSLSRFLIAVCSSLKGFDLKQTAIDVLAVSFAFLFVSVCAASIVISFFILFFVRVA